MKEIARNIIIGYINKSNLSFEEKISEIAFVTSDDKILLEHIDNVIKVMSEAKKELESNNE